MVSNVNPLEPPGDPAAGPARERVAESPSTRPTTVGVRFGYMKHLGEFNCPPSVELDYDRRVIVQTARGIELGELVLLNRLRGETAVAPEQIARFVDTSGAEYYRLNSGRVLRSATDDDLLEYDHIRAGARAKMEFCERLATLHELPMKLVDCECLFGGERIIFYFMAEGRIDFRALVKDLAREYQTRIEMRQVGARDEARLMADFETCGQECCCRIFLKTLKPITMKMAKMQKATLDPSKVSGRCGRLKCCLRYEHSAYEELDGDLPKLGARVECRHGCGMVVARQLLTQLVQIETDEGGRVTLPAEALGDPPEPTAGPRESDRRRTSDRGRPRTRPPRNDPPPTDSADPPPAGAEPSRPESAGPAPNGDRAPNRKYRRRSSRRRSRRRRPPGNGAPGP